jgi:hypothetical protein
MAEENQKCKHGYSHIKNKLFGDECKGDVEKYGRGISEVT